MHKKNNILYMGGGSGTSNYNDLTNRPQVNGVTLSGNKTSAQLKLAGIDDVIVKSDTLPEATSSNVGAIYQYSGVSNEDYTHGYIYENKDIGAYTTTVTFQASSSGVTISCSGADFLAFVKEFISNPANLTQGTMTYDGTSGLWAFVGKNSSSTTIGTYQMYQEDYEGIGFTFTGTPQDGDVVNFTCSISGTASYVWTRIDVQPGGNGIILQANNNTTINGYQVPQLTVEQITQAYNGIVAGKQVVITDTTGLMHFTVNQADMVSDEPIISIEYFDIMELTYTTDGIEYRIHNNQITLTEAEYEALTEYAEHCDYRIIED